jgi:hypothetical protein
MIAKPGAFRDREPGLHEDALVEDGTEHRGGDRAGGQW